MSLLLEREKQLRYRRIMRRRRRKVEGLGQQADENIERLLIRRLNRLVSVRRFVAAWTLLFILLIFATALQVRGLGGYHQVLKPAPGGVFSEGMVGTFTNANPLYATGAADGAVSRLVFSGLFTYSPDNKLVPDLAEKMEINAAETKYVVTLKRGVTWHDGQPFTAKDVVYTYQTIQNPDAKSSLLPSWQGIKVSSQDDQIVTFELPNPLSSFPYALVNGLVPRHLLEGIPAGQLRSASFNSSPVGTGPFRWKSVEVFGGNNNTREQRVTLSASNSYHLGPPQLDGFTIRTFRDEAPLIESFNNKEIIAMSGLGRLPQNADMDELVEYRVPLTSAVMAFFNNSRAILQDVKVRRALVQSIDRKQLIPQLERRDQIIESPLLPGQLGYDKTVSQLPYNPAEATALLEAAGWKQGADGVRTKGNQKLRLSFRSQNTHDYIMVAQYLQRVWGQLGVMVEVRYLEADELQSSIIANHEYDVLLYGISIGADPDVFAYWHSSQASLTSQGHLNLSEYKSQVADQALEAGRIRSNPTLRSVKYKPFLEAWRNDAPALALYQPSYLYVSRSDIYNLNTAGYNTSADRLNNVHQWMIREQKQDIQ